MKSILVALLVGALCSFLYQVREVGNARIELAAIRAEIADKTSISTVTGGMIRSFFDGLTLGVFADEGIFTESKKFERWNTDASRRQAALNAAHSGAVSMRNWSFAVVICASGVLLFGRFREHRHAAGRAAARQPTAEA